MQNNSGTLPTLQFIAISLIPRTLDPCGLNLDSPTLRQVAAHRKADVHCRANSLAWFAIATNSANSCNQKIILEAPGVKERKLAWWGLSRGKAWKGSLNVTKKKTPPKWKPTRPCWRTRSRWNLFPHAVSEGDQGNPNGMVAGKPQTCAF